MHQTFGQPWLQPSFPLPPSLSVEAVPHVYALMYNTDYELLNVFYIFLLIFTMLYIFTYFCLYSQCCLYLHITVLIFSVVYI